MTLVIKQLTIKGEVIGEDIEHENVKLSETELIQVLEGLKKEVKEECMERLQEILDSQLIR
ncbi:hypothetical protein JYB64_08735 [Algoriphagus aestuarii]|nr:hypothetical protein [Algoriphagus aestuarii]